MKRSQYFVWKSIKRKCTSALKTYILIYLKTLKSAIFFIDSKNAILLKINYSNSRGLKLKVPTDDVPFHLSMNNFGLMSL